MKKQQKHVDLFEHVIERLPVSDSYGWFSRDDFRAIDIEQCYTFTCQIGYSCSALAW